MIEDVRSIVQKECDPWNWHYHMLPVVQYARQLAGELGVDVELAELAYVAEWLADRDDPAAHATIAAAAVRLILQEER